MLKAKLRSPDNYCCKTKIDPGLPEEQRLILKCVSYIIQRGGYNEEHRYVRIRNEDFPVNNSGKLSRATALSAALRQELIYIDNSFAKGCFSKGYRALKKGYEELARNSRPVFSNRAIEWVPTQFKAHPFFVDNLEIQQMYPELLQQLELSNRYKGPPGHSLEAYEFFRAFRKVKSGDYRLIVDDQRRIYHPLTNMKKRFRQFFSFRRSGGAPLVEVDIRCSNPVMMVKSGIVDEEERAEWENLILGGTFYEDLALPGASRKQSKVRINSIFNGGGFRPGTKTPTKTRELLTKRFPRTMKKVQKPIGTVLMSMESELMNEIVYRLNRGLGIKAVRLHDAILCDPEDAEVVAALFWEDKLPSNFESVPLEGLI